MAKLMALWLLVLSVATTALVTAQTSVPVGTECTQPRIRRPWENFTPEEKTQYIDAVKLAMTRGFHQKFVELHIEWSSEKEAHQNCLFMYWHRMYLLGYENMLRSLKPEYQCITIPYWDHLSATARRASGTCNYLEDCSPIYQDFGGSTIGVDKDLIVYNTKIVDTTETKCITQSMLGSFCGNNTVCAGCVLRGSASKKAYPTEAAFASVYQQVFTYNDWVRFGDSVERGVHNMVHSTLGGMMSYFQSPIDPIFYTHHGVIDLLQTIYFKCQMGSETAKLSGDQKGSDPRVWSNCPRRSGIPFKKTDTITMKTLDYGGKTVDVRTAPNNMLYPFFKDLPATFSAYVDAKDLGKYSYTYQMQGALANMYTNCKASNTVKAAVRMAEEHQDAVARQEYEDPLPVIEGPTKTDTKFRLWTIAVYESAKLAGYTDEAARDQMELMLCFHSQECLGGVNDYDPLFRENFGVTGHPRCFTLLEQLNKGKKIIGVPEWHDISSKFLPCPVPIRNADGTYHHHHADDYKDASGKVVHGHDDGDDDHDNDGGEEDDKNVGWLGKIYSKVTGQGDKDKGTTYKDNGGETKKQAEPYEVATMTAATS